MVALKYHSHPTQTWANFEVAFPENSEACYPLPAAGLQSEGESCVGRDEESERAAALRDRIRTLKQPELSGFFSAASEPTPAD